MFIFCERSDVHSHDGELDLYAIFLIIYLFCVVYIYILIANVVLVCGCLYIVVHFFISFVYNFVPFCWRQRFFLSQIIARLLFLHIVFSLTSWRRQCLLFSEIGWPTISGLVES